MTSMRGEGEEKGKGQVGRVTHRAIDTWSRVIKYLHIPPSWQISALFARLNTLFSI